MSLSFCTGRYASVFRFGTDAFLHPTVIQYMLRHLDRYVVDTADADPDLVDRDGIPRVGDLDLDGVSGRWWGVDALRKARREILADRTAGIRICVPWDVVQHMGFDPCACAFRHRQDAIRELHMWLVYYPKDRQGWLAECDLQERRPENPDRAWIRSLIDDASVSGQALAARGAICPAFTAISPRRLARGIRQDQTGTWWAEPGSYECTICRYAPSFLLDLRCCRRRDLHAVWNAFFTGVWNGLGMTGALRLPEPDGVTRETMQELRGFTRLQHQPKAEWLEPHDAEAVAVEALRVAAASGLLVSYDELQREGFSPDVIEHQLGDPDHVLDGQRFVDAERAAVFRTWADVQAPGGLAPTVSRSSLLINAGWGVDMLETLGRAPLLHGDEAYYPTGLVSVALHSAAWAAIVAQRDTACDSATTWTRSASEAATRSLIHRGRVLWHQPPTTLVRR